MLFLQKSHLNQLVFMVYFVKNYLRFKPQTMKKIPRKIPFQPEKMIKKIIPKIIRIIGIKSSNLYFINFISDCRFSIITL